MATRVRDFIQRIKVLLQDTDDPGTRWTNDELISYLNEAYDFVLTYVPEASTIQGGFLCEAGTRQTLPDNGLRLLSVIRNRDGSLRPIRRRDKASLDRERPNWHNEPDTLNQEFWVYDDREPRVFYVYPPASKHSNIEIGYTLDVQDHIPRDYENTDTLLRLDDRYKVALLNYILYCAFDKDSDFTGNGQRAEGYLAKAANALGLKLQNDVRTSPRNRSNPQ